MLKAIGLSFVFLSTVFQLAIIYIVYQCRNNQQKQDKKNVVQKIDCDPESTTNLNENLVCYKLFYPTTWLVVAQNQNLIQPLTRKIKYNNK
jgi:hypothetical protein